MMLRAAHFACIALGATFASCLDPTEIVLVVSTDVACSDVAEHGVSIAIGAPNDDTTVASASTHDCSSDGGLGTLTVLPHGISDGVGIRVMLGVDASVENCDVAHDFAGCIVARRALRFDPHRPLTLPIELQASCVGQKCSPDSTCFNGSCVDASVACTDTSCDLDASPPPPPPPPPPAKCIAVSPKVIETSAFAYTPHIAKLPSGYLVTWIVPMGGSLWLGGATLDPMGTVTTTFNLQKLTGLAATGPIGTDGVTWATFLYDPTNASPLTVVYAQLNGTFWSFGTPGIAPTDGVLANGAGAYDSLFENQTTAGLYSVAANNVITPLTPFANLDLTAAYGFGLARAGNTTFASFVRNNDQHCTINECTSGTCAEKIAYGNCSNVRLVAKDATSWTAVTASASTATLAESLNGSVSSMPLTSATIAQPDAILPIATSNGSYAFLRDNTESLLRFTLTAGPPLTVDTNLAYGTRAGGSAAGFDGIADDPIASPAQVLVYFKSDGSTAGITVGTGAIYFTRLCQ